MHSGTTFSQELWWQVISNLPVFAVLLTISLIPISIVALVQWRKVHTLRQYRGLVETLVNKGCSPRDVDRIIRTIGCALHAIRNDIPWDEIEY